ncbi:MAG TPA: heme exporter protein CcmB [Thermoanaerobaculales bacterium]|nr:heme exporter protein CcmB [Thermoanaerobaculales bacterium]HPA82726.1 heme exporter protein CcmB [Thermoanaerobaculales bacterium]HQL29617.1 heme exporter protein CcmB [Thermoanaerobaculales bacterium]HQN97666.1 heme exporter protein CcmB [Thermoanaerobaculales bacterium]
MWRWLAEAWAVTAKDLRTEFRTRVALSSVGLFALTTLIAVAYSVGPFRISAEDRPFLLAVLLWIVVFFAGLAGLDRSFVKEEESHTAPLLRLSASPHVVWAGKLLFNLVLLAVLLAAVVPLYCVLMGYRIQLLGWFVALLAAGGYTLAVEATIVAAIIARAQGRGALFPVLALPLLLALLVFLIQGTTATAEGAVATVGASLRAVVSLGGAMTVVSAMLFPLVWND